MTRTASQIGRHSKRKGRTREQELVRRHKEIGIHAERVAPLQASKNSCPHHGNKWGDVDIYPQGEERGAWVSECKSGDQVPKSISKWLGENDALFLRPDRQEWMVVLPWRIWEKILGQL